VAERLAIYRRRQLRSMERAAWMVHHIMSAFIGEKAPSINRLLGKETDG
jgi:hypothetical protein